ncbi:zinc finger CCCH domain-containing protein [Trifolium repens]|nr:zinc finger CCCH domain-containing protein [Trifolium repens]
MGDEDDQQWHFVKGRHGKAKGNLSHLPDIATAKRARQEKYDNLTTYFFSDFPNSFGAKALFNAFGYYGDIVEVVIPAKMDKGGRCFGFARFDQVRDVQRFEQELDRIMVGRDKISVNLSRFHRTETAWRPVTDTKDVEGYGRSGKRNGDEKR